MVAYARGLDLLSSEHFAVDGTLIEANASRKSFKRKGRDGDPPAPPPDDPGSPSVDFHGEQRSNATHRSTTDPEARLKKKGKGKEVRLVFEGHGLMENRHGLGADKGYDILDCVADMRARGVTPHVTQNVTKTHRSAIDGRTTQHRLCHKSAHPQAD